MESESGKKRRGRKETEGKYIFLQAFIRMKILQEKEILNLNYK